MQLLAVLEVEISAGSVPWGLHIPVGMCGEHGRRLHCHRSHRFMWFLGHADLIVGTDLRASYPSSCLET